LTSNESSDPWRAQQTTVISKKRLIRMCVFRMCAGLSGARRSVYPPIQRARTRHLKHAIRGAIVR